MTDSIYPTVQAGLNAMVSISTAAAVAKTAQKAFEGKKKKGAPKF